MKAEDTCACGNGARLIYACSGAADVGALADRTARWLHLAGWGKMHCLAGVGGGLDAIVSDARGASQVMAIDGCSLHCARLCLENSGINVDAHLCLTDLGWKKGNCPADDTKVKRAAEHCQGLLS